MESARFDSQPAGAGSPALALSAPAARAPVLAHACAIAIALTWMLLCLPVGAMAQAGAPRPVDQRALLQTVGTIYQVDPQLLAAIASVESGGNPQAVSPKGALGLMQLMPETASELGVANPFDPVSNTVGAARFLSYLRQSHLADPNAPATLPEIIAAYNAGPGAVQKNHGIQPYQETRDYVRSVLLKYLFGDGAKHFRVHSVPARPDMIKAGSAVTRTSSPRQIVVTPESDALDKLAAIRRERALALRHERSGAPGASPAALP